MSRTNISVTFAALFLLLALGLGTWALLLADAEMSKTAASLCGPLATLAGFCFAVAQFQRGEEWRKAEFLAKLVNDFHSNKSIQMALRMLDWSSRVHEIFPSHGFEEYRYAHIDHSLVISALRVHNLQTAHFRTIESHIRDNFDCLFDHLEKVQSHIDSEVVDSSKALQHLEYYLELALAKRAERDNTYQHEVALSVWFYTRRFFPVAHKLLKDNTNGLSLDATVETSFQGLQDSLSEHVAGRDQLVPSRGLAEASKSTDVAIRKSFDNWLSERNAVVKQYRDERNELLRAFHARMDYTGHTWKPLATQP